MKLFFGVYQEDSSIKKDNSMLMSSNILTHGQTDIVATLISSRFTFVRNPKKWKGMRRLIDGTMNRAS